MLKQFEVMTSNFFHVDSINVFRFIDIVSTKAIKSFEKIEEIEQYLSDQISGMFYLYLESLKLNNKQNEIYDAVSELKTLTTNITTIINEVGKEIIKPDRYEEVIHEQFEILLNYFVEKLIDAIDVSGGVMINEAVSIGLTNFFIKNILTNEMYEKVNFHNYGKDYAKWRKVTSSEIINLNNMLDNVCKNFKVTDKITSIISDYCRDIKPLIIDDYQSEQLQLKLRTELYSMLPF